MATLILAINRFVHTQCTAVDTLRGLIMFSKIVMGSIVTFLRETDVVFGTGSGLTVTGFSLDSRLRIHANFQQGFSWREYEPQPNPIGCITAIDSNQSLFESTLPACLLGRTLRCLSHGFEWC